MKTTLQIKSSLLTAIGFFLLFSTSCIDDNYDLDKMSSGMQLTPNVALPLVIANISMEDLLRKLDSTAILQSRHDTLYVDYSNTLYSSSASDLLKIPQQDPAAFSIPSPSPAVMYPATQVYLIPFSTTVDLVFEDGAQFDSIFVKKGVISLNINSTFNTTASLEFNLPRILTDKRAVFKGSAPISNNASTVQYVIDNYVIKPDYSTPGKIKLPINGYLKVRGTAGTWVESGRQALVNVSLANLSFSKVFGYAGKKSVFEQKESLSLNSFNNSFLNNIKLENPHFEIVVKNSFGADVTLVMKDVNIASLSSSQPVKFVDPITKTIINTEYSKDLNRPTLANLGQSVDTKIVFDTTTTDLFNYINGDLYKLNCTFSASTKDKVTGSTVDFALDTSKITIWSHFYTPLAFKTLTSSGLSRPDTIDLDFSSMKDELDNVNSVTILMDATNNFPINIKLNNVAVIDSFGNKLLDLFKNRLVESGKTTTNLESEKIENQNLENLKKGKKLIIQTTVTSKDYLTGKYVTLTTKDNLTLKFKIRAQAKIDLK